MGITTDDVRTYVVNLPRRTDRRAQIAEMLPSEWKPIYTSDWPGLKIDGRELDQEYLERCGFRVFDWQIESDNFWWSRPLKLGEIGCTLAHLACWRDAASQPEPYVMVLEDDAVPVPGFSDRLLARLDTLRSECPFDLLYLGRFPLEGDTPALPGLVTPGYSHCTFGYLLSRSGLECVLDADVGNDLVPVDEFLPALYVDHPRADLRARYPRRMRALAFEPPLVWQRDKTVAGSDTEDSAEIPW